MLYVVVLMSFAALVAGGRSPNAGYIEELIRDTNITAYISSDLLEDALLDVVSNDLSNTKAVSLRCS